MRRNFQQWEFSLQKEMRGTVWISIGLLSLFWWIIGLGWFGISLSILRSVVGTCLMMFVPGMLLVRLLGLETESFGIFYLFSVGLSFAFLGIITSVGSSVLLSLGISAPLSMLPLALVLTALIAVLVAGVWFHADEATRPHITFRCSFPLLLSLLLLPTVAAVAAILMGHFQVNTGMFLFVFTLEAVVLLTATRVIPPNLYPVSVFSVLLSLLLHRNLITEHVVGADIQITYFVADLVLQNQYWYPDMSGSLIALPMVTSVPAAFAAITGLELTTVFTVVYAILFSTVPATLFYLYNNLFDENVAVYGCLFFAFYHVSFYFTPGKQLISELFLALLLLLFFRHGLDEGPHKVAALLLVAGLVQSHYGMAYVFGISLLAVAIGFLFIRLISGETDNNIPLIYPVVFLTGATGWYVYASRELIEALSSVPLSVASQLALLVAETPFLAEGTGASTVQEQTTAIEEINLYLYLLLTVLIIIGLAWRVLITFTRIRRDDDIEHIEFTALAIPFFVFLAITYVVILNLWVDRVYQMVLVVLAPFMPLGYVFVSRIASGIWIQFEQPIQMQTGWILLSLLLGTLLMFNIGAVAALAGPSSPYTFNPDAQDYAYSHAELEGGNWIKRNGSIEPVETNQPDERKDTVRIYTDSHSYQMFRSILPQRHYDVEVIRLKSQWNPQFDRTRIGDGYVFIRNRSLVDESDGERVPLTRLSRTNASEITRSGDVIYNNGDVVIVAVGTTGDQNQSSSNRSSPTSMLPVPTEIAPQPYTEPHGALNTEYGI